jgi:hypothetical protein
MFNELPTSLKLTSATYIFGIFGYNCLGSYNESKMYLFNYRNKCLNEDEEYLIKNDWDAVKYGAKYKFFDRFINSLIWPVTGINNIIPIIVLKMNPRLEDKNE